MTPLSKTDQRCILKTTFVNDHRHFFRGDNLFLLFKSTLCPPIPTKEVIIPSVVRCISRGVWNLLIILPFLLLLASNFPSSSSQTGLCVLPLHLSFSHTYFWPFLFLLQKRRMVKVRTKTRRMLKNHHWPSLEIHMTSVTLSYDVITHSHIPPSPFISHTPQTQ